MEIICPSCKTKVTYSYSDITLDFKRDCHIDKETKKEICEDKIIGAYIICPHCKTKVKITKK
ncbi:MAG: hypothetical protein MJ227_02820 [Bacilli bacterium]|nr:hypothetical protein [Bacilli bacterium]